MNRLEKGQVSRRERQILECINQGTSHILDMVPLMYSDTPELMYPAAARSVLAAMENLVRNQQVRVEGEGGAPPLPWGTRMEHLHCLGRRRVAGPPTS